MWTSELFYRGNDSQAKAGDCEWESVKASQSHRKPKKLKAGHDRHDRHEANNGRGHKAGLGRGRGAGRGRGMAVSETEAWKSGRQVSLSAGCQVLSGSVECGFWNVSHVATVQASSLYCVIS